MRRAREAKRNAGHTTRDAEYVNATLVNGTYTVLLRQVPCAHAHAPTLRKPRFTPSSARAPLQEVWGLSWCARSHSASQGSRGAGAGGHLMGELLRTGGWGVGGQGTHRHSPHCSRICFTLFSAISTACGACRASTSLGEKCARVECDLGSCRATHTCVSACCRAALQQGGAPSWVDELVRTSSGVP